MSSTPHSLNFSQSGQQIAEKRNSLGSKLPLPATLTNPQQRLPGEGAAIVGAGPSNLALHMRGLSESSTHAFPEVHQLNSPTSAAFPTSASMHLSSTHAGGIQPSASFFRPSRPNYQMQYSRPNSTSSAEGGNISIEPDHYPLSNIKHHSASSDDPVSDRGRDSMTEDHHQFVSLKRQKQSREPLIPISARPGGLISGPSLSRDRKGSGSAAPRSPTRTTTRMVRNSLDRVFNLSRGLSFDSIRKSSTSRPQNQSDGRTFDSKMSDDDRGFENLERNMRYKQPPLPIYNGRRLSVNASHHSEVLSAPSPSPDPSFIPTRPNRVPPLSALPIINEKTGKVVRRYETHKSRNRFYFSGRVLTGGDTPWAFVASFGLLLTIAGVWFGTTCVWWWKNKSPAVAAVGAYMALLTISTMLATATCDPGILPRNLDPNPPYPTTSPSDGGMRAPMPRDLKVRNEVVRVKYCPTCKTYRPPRSSHCKMCDNCVDGCDHHCQWVNNCVGRRNYTSFFVLLLSATLTLILIICTSALHLFFLTRRDHIDFRHALAKGAGSAVAFCLAMAIIWPVAALLSYHMRLLLLNITTIEQIRNQAHKTLVPGPAPPNPFSHGNWRRNLIAVLCRPQGQSWLNPSGVATEDKRDINPGFTDGVGVWDGHSTNLEES